MVEFIESIITQLSGQKPEVKLSEDEEGIVVDVIVNGNVRNVIGKKGRTIDAIRVIARALGHEGKHQIKINVSDGKTAD